MEGRNVTDKITIDNIKKIDVSDGDVLVVTMPDMRHLPVLVERDAMRNMGKYVKATFKDHDIEIMVVHHGVKIEVFKKDKG